MKKFFYKIVVFAVMLFGFFGSIGPGLISIAQAAELENYTSVIEDLSKDESFDVNSYKADPSDHALDIVQISESANKELFVYVYQPSGETKELTVTTIRMSMPVVGKDTEWKDYPLTLISKSGVFQKYKVVGVTVSDDLIRYYDIVGLHRKFDDSIDDKAGTNVDQTINEVVVDVAQLWTLQTLQDGSVAYSMQTTEVIEVTGKVVGFLRYHDKDSLPGFIALKKEKTDSHFVAFSTDKRIENLLEADISYCVQSKQQLTVFFPYRYSITYGNKDFVSLQTIDKTQTGSNSGQGLFAKKYEWKRIESASSFLSSNKDDINYVVGAEKDLKTNEWVIRFYESSFTETTTEYTNTVNSTIVSEVSLLRLKFITNGKTYNLGVVDDKRTGSDNPLGTGDTYWDDFLKWLKDMLEDIWTMLLLGLGLIFLFIVLIVFWPIIKPVWNLVVSFCWKLVKGAFKLVFWLIKLPFVLIGLLFKRNRE